jgi:glycine/D-amino acid oxidase-like deaminating enzyme
MAKVAVIGAGIIGMAASRALQRDGHEVIVFDPQGPGLGCSFGNAGHVALDHIRPLARPDVLRAIPRFLTTPLGPLCLKPHGAIRMLPWLSRFAWACRPAQVGRGTTALAALLAQAQPAWSVEIAASRLAPLFEQRGSLVLYEREVAEGAAEAALLAEHGVTVEMLSMADAAQLVPGLQVPIAGGRLLPTASHSVDPYAVVRTLAGRFVAEGGRIEQIPVRGFDIAAGCVRRVDTGSARHSVDHIVLAAGAGAAALARQLGAAAPLARERGYHVMLPPGSLELSRPVTFAERGFVMTPMAGGIRLAGTVELGAGADPDWRRADVLLAHARQIFGRPSLVQSSRWFGDRPTLPDYLPIIGPAPRAGNAFLAIGHQHLGLTLAAVTGAIIAALVAGRPSPVPIDQFQAARFGQG